MKSRILLALDFDDLETARDMAEITKEHVAGYKVGLELMMTEGPGVIGAIAVLGLPVFADAKLHDIPRQVAGAARSLASHGARWVTAHAAGGRAMLEAAAEGMASVSGAEEAGILAVTVLTSLDEGDLRAIGVDGSMSSTVTSRAALAEGSGVEGVVCSPGEVAAVKSTTPSLLVVTPGIRLENSDSGDQKRVATPEAALAAGADLLVMGRVITAAPDPAAAAESIAVTTRWPL